jgi:hypothetical protein
MMMGEMAYQTVMCLSARPDFCAHFVTTARRFAINWIGHGVSASRERRWMLALAVMMNVGAGKAGGVTLEV